MRRRGLTLLETTLAVGLVAVALLVLIGVFTGGMQLMSRSGEIADATEAGRQLLETVKRNGYDKIPADTRTFDGRAGDPPLDDFPPSPYPQATLPSGGTYPLLVHVEPRTGTALAVRVEAYYSDTGKVVLFTEVHP